MSIHSNSFGRVTLTDEDAKKFRNQVAYGKPKQVAKDSMQRGVEIVRQFNENKGRVTVSLKRR
ncbi:MAG: hypothetical protein M9932_01760 [Xanthobacteraceae bacterium]|nr:hypothetical protein [Xanthobacteraceae bacterium]